MRLRVSYKRSLMASMSKGVASLDSKKLYLMVSIFVRCFVTYLCRILKESTCSTEIMLLKFLD